MSESSYHGRMMNIRRSEDDAREASSAAPHMAAAYAYGHRDARHAAAEIALEADARIARLEAALRQYADRGNWIEGEGGDEGTALCLIGPDVADAALEGESDE